ncbi:hypothetical protein PBI_CLOVERMINNIE_62 [Gordonia phage CloverMinnie]|nr:hypothetical protein PBI_CLOVERMINNIE_62 [Gordonia phage CloverMinnie]
MSESPSATSDFERSMLQAARQIERAKQMMETVSLMMGTEVGEVELTPELCRAAARAARFADVVLTEANDKGRSWLMGFDLDYLASAFDDMAIELEAHPL